MESFSQNRLYRGDCLEVMRQLHGEGIAPDLIYLDPPFNSNRNYHFIFPGGGEGAQQTAFSDMWQKQYREETEREIADIAGDLGIDGRLIKMLKSWAAVLGGGDAGEIGLFNYLLYMTRRLIWCHKILAPRGSMYLHCDPTASHYLKIVLDLIFGRDGFRNEIIWGYKTGGVPSVRGSFARKHDVVLFYAKPNNIFNAPTQKSYVPTLPEPHTASGKRLGVMRDNIEKYRNVYMRDYWINTGIMPGDDIREMYRNDRERMGYPTQKPVSLLERIVKASSNGGGLVLDPFCGCGTTIHAAHNLKRKWIGVDISLDAVKHIKDRIREHMFMEAEKHYAFIECGAQTRREYDRLTPYEKQEWLVRQIGGVCGPRGGDGGVDGVIRYHAGGEGLNFDEFIISVKTGKQANPNMLDSLKGVMEKRGAKMGGLILDRNPTAGMLSIVQKSRKIKYKLKIVGVLQTLSEHPSLQILTADQILDGGEFSIPPTLMEKKMKAK